MRINRFLAAAGLGSRRNCEELILGGKVTINGHICQNLATEVTDQDFVKVGNKHIVPETPLYILLHKPRGYLCTATDTHERKTIFDLLPGKWPRLFHVGRLDRESEGLIILTNDGDLALRMTHPRFKMDKEYEVLLDKAYDAHNDTPKMLKGMNIEGGRASAESVREIAQKTLRIVLRQGLKRQLRLMLYKLGYEVERLIRVRIGPLRMADLRVGEHRALSAQEVKSLLAERPAPPKKPVIAARPKTPDGRSEAKSGKPRGADRGAAKRETGRKQERNPERMPAAKSGKKPGEKPWRELREKKSGPFNKRQDAKTRDGSQARRGPGRAGARSAAPTGRRGSGASAPRGGRRP